MESDASEGMSKAEARQVFLYPSGVARMMCSTDNDGYPTCQGDTGMCGYSAVLKQQVCEYIKESQSWYIKESQS